MEFEEEQIWSKDLYLTAGYSKREEFGVFFFGKCKDILCHEGGENHIILDNRIWEVYMWEGGLSE